LGEQLERLFAPESVAIFGREGTSWAPLFARGFVVPPAVELEGPLMDALRERERPLAVGRSARRPGVEMLEPFERAVLETLGTDVVFPVRRGDAIALLVCLGGKRSGDVYTQSELRLLDAVGDKVKTELERYDQAELIRQARAMQEALQRYVPDPIAHELAERGELGEGKSVVSVLFVDLRGYTAFSEDLSAEHIFTTVNRYTQASSDVIREHGGCVVEFNGDGMMAVFGAPRPLADMEEAAVRAGREIVRRVSWMGSRESAPLTVGVGIATGEAYVGNIRSSDRLIWSAIGNTTNLAARLQALTRELDAAIVIDAATCIGAKRITADFESRPATPIRGRREPVDLYLLPLAG